MITAQTNDTHFSLSPEEAAIHTPLWLSAEEIEQEITRDAHKKDTN
jgi:hypothetical protein